MRASTSATAESGNVLIYILIAVVLFAALSFAFTQTQQGGQGAKSTLSEGQASLTASQILSHINDVEKAYQSLEIMSGCDPVSDEISFDTPSHSDIPGDSNAPADKSCHIFFDNGGGVEPPLRPHVASTTSEMSALNKWGLYSQGSSHSFRHHAPFNEVNTNADAEDLYIISVMQKSVCKKINKQKAGTDKIPQYATDINASCSACADANPICTQFQMTSSTNARVSDSFYVHYILTRDMQ
jgi:hypothetical protein